MRIRLLAEFNPNHCLRHRQGRRFRVETAFLGNGPTGYRSLCQLSLSPLERARINHVAEVLGQNLCIAEQPCQPMA